MAGFSTNLRRAAQALLLMGVSAHPVAAQETARLRAEENFRTTPNGEVVARLRPGVSVEILEEQGGWARTRLEGWVWTRSLQIDSRDGFDLVVAAVEGENIRGDPTGRGPVLGRLVRGAFLEEMERRPGWIRVRRYGWIWRASLDTPREAGVSPTTDAESPGEPAPAAGSRSVPPPATGPAGATPPSEFSPAGGRGAAILTSPDGDTLARATPGSELEVVSRQGSWARVRLEGWTWMPVDSGGTPNAADDDAALGPGDVSAAPEASRGRVVTWRLQFISLEKAERVRTDFFEGEPFLLTRHGGTNGPFIYVAIPVERSSELSGLVPLEEVEITGRVRTGASALTGTAILDLISFRRVR